MQYDLIIPLFVSFKKILGFFCFYFFELGRWPLGTISHFLDLLPRSGATGSKSMNIFKALDTDD